MQRNYAYFFQAFFFNCLRLIVADKINFYIPGMGNSFWLTWVNLIFGLSNILCTSNLILKKRAHWVGIKNVQVKKIKNSSLLGHQSWSNPGTPFPAAEAILTLFMCWSDFFFKPWRNVSMTCFISLLWNHAEIHASLEQFLSVSSRRRLSSRL